MRVFNILFFQVDRIYLPVKMGIRVSEGYLALERYILFIYLFTFVYILGIWLFHTIIFVTRYFKLTIYIEYISIRTKAQGKKKHQ